MPFGRYPVTTTVKKMFAPCRLNPQPANQYDKILLVAALPAGLDNARLAVAHRYKQHSANLFNY